MPKSPSIDELNRLYSEGETCDQELFAEQRSNVLLASGDHYAKKSSKWWNRVREAKELQNDQKLRLTKNHMHKITRIYENNIISQSPGVVPIPNNPKELQDQKAAELNKSVWEYAKTCQHLRAKTQSWCKDFIEIGECIAKIYWDPMAGRHVAYEQSTNEDGSLSYDEQGQPISSGKAIFTGDLVLERVHAFNLVRPSEAKTMEEAKWLCIRKMVHVEDLKKLAENLSDDEKKKIQSTQDETYFVFDGNRSNYTKADKQALVKEFYFRQSYDYPEGWFVIQTGELVIAEGPLPYGIFPIVYEGFDEIQTTPRHRSIIKQLRPYQYEINRAGSKMAEHQVTLGDDKVILQNGSKVTNGPHLPGVRTMFVTGQEPTILAGRSGDQFLAYMTSQISEMYQVANVAEDTEEKEGGDAFANLYRSIRDKKKFSIYAEKFENFLVNLCRTYLELAKEYFDEQMLIPAVGKSEYINIAEFKSTEPLKYQIKVEPLNEDTTTMMGRHLVLNHVLQYVGGNLEKDDIGKIIRQMPFANHEETFSDFTLNYDTATNLILSLDRGEEPIISRNDDEQYMLKRLSARQKQSDYRLLDQDIQARYEQSIQAYEQIASEKAQAIKQAQNEFIPASGAAIKCDYYIPDPNQPSRSIRATIPAEALDWLIKRLEEQGSAQAQLSQQTTRIQQDLASQFLAGQSNGGMLPPQPQQGMVQ